MKYVAASLLILTLTACGETAKLPLAAGIGPNPKLPTPHKTLFPTVKIADAIGWTRGAKPAAAAGFVVAPYATGLDHPRWLYVLPNGDTLVAETNAPPKPDDAKGIKGFFMKIIMKKAGAGPESPNRITLLRDADGDGVAETRTVLLKELNSPFGMALIGDQLYIADTDAVLKFPYHTGDTVITAPGTKVADLPAGTINHHWTKNIIASPDDKKIYATVGSNSNAGENGITVETERANILEIDLATGAKRIFAGGLRNPNGMGWQPQSSALWTVVNERDEIGSDLVPDYMTSVKDGAFYGWPYSYYGQNVDVRVKPQDSQKVASAIKPDYALGPHTASLGMTFYSGNLFPARYKGGAFVGQHGSWNRNPPSGYDVIFIPFADGMPTGAPENILTGFLDKDGKAMGRPVGVAIDGKGALLVADDVGNVIWRVTPAS